MRNQTEKSKARREKFGAQIKNNEHKV